MQMYKCLLTPLHPPNMYMLELSPKSTKCTHCAVVKLFCRYFGLMTIEPSSISRRIVDLGMGISKMSCMLALMLMYISEQEKTRNSMG
jgi:hypothetical protein